VVSITPRPRFTPGQRAPGTHCTGGWVGPRAGPDAEVRGKVLCLCRGSHPGRPVRSQTLYRLSYRLLLGHVLFNICINVIPSVRSDNNPTVLIYSDVKNATVRSRSVQLTVNKLSSVIKTLKPRFKIRGIKLLLINARPYYSR
jgi:hypothetical protein